MTHKIKAISAVLDDRDIAMRISRLLSAECPLWQLPAVVVRDE